MTATLSVLDVGHGNAAVIRGDSGVVVVDAGPGGGGLLQYLQDEGIEVLDSVVISHADEDHLRGLLGILESTSVEIKEVRVNANALQATDVWNDVVFSLDHLDQNATLDYQVACVRGDELPEVAAGVTLEVLGPVKALAGHGPGWTDHSGRTVTTNSCSVVVRIRMRGEAVAVLPGDLDEIGLAYLTACDADLRAQILVFPHHGGAVASGAGQARNRSFAAALMAEVQPNTVIFSQGRRKYSNPRPEIVDEVRAHNATVRIACTQLSIGCRAKTAGNPPSASFGHLNALHARGKANRECCSGTLRIDLDGSVEPPDDEHESFKRAWAPMALCLGALGVTAIQLAASNGPGPGDA